MQINLYNRHRIYLTSALMDLVYAFVVGAVAVYAVELGATAMQLGYIGSLGAALYALSCYLSGHLPDHLSRKKIVFWATLFSALSCLGLANSTVLSRIYLFFGSFNFALGFFWPNLQSLLADSRHRRSLTATLGNFCVFWSLGFTVGHYICGYLTRISSTFPLGWSVALCFAILAVNLTLSDSEALKKMGSADFLSRIDNKSRLLWSRFLICGWLANFSVVFIVGSAKMLFPKLALDVDHLDRQTLGLMLALIHAGQVLTFLVTKYWHGWQYNRRTFLLTQFLTLPGAGLLALTSNSFCYAAGMFLIGSSYGFTYSASIYYSTSRPPEFKTRTGIHEAFIGLGILFGPLIGGFVSLLWNLHAPYFFGLLLLVATIGIQAMILYRPLKESATN